MFVTKSGVTFALKLCLSVSKIKIFSFSGSTLVDKCFGENQNFLSFLGEELDFLDE